jgi:hypothetical protein
MYVLYEYVTRYIMKTGTNPTTYYQFFWGLFAYVAANAPVVIYMYVLLLILAVVMYAFKQTHFAKILSRIVIDVTITFLVMVSIFWLRYKIWNKR